MNKNEPCFTIAELSANHGGDINIAKETIKAAKRTGADAINLQTYTADTLTIDVKYTSQSIFGKRIIHGYLRASTFF